MSFGITYVSLSRSFVLRHDFPLGYARADAYCSASDERVRTNHVTLSWSLALMVSLGDDNHWIVAAVGALAGVYLFYRGFRMLQRKRLILNTPASKIRSAAMGLVEISGLATGPYTMAAPITGMPCYYYRTMAWQWQRAWQEQ